MFDLHTISFLLIFYCRRAGQRGDRHGIAHRGDGPAWPADAAAGRSGAAGPSLAAHQSLAVTGRPGAGADCTPSLVYDDRDYYWHVGRILTADRPQSSVVGAGAWRRIDSLCRVCALQSGVSGFRPRGEVAVAAHGRADRRYHRGDRGICYSGRSPGYRRWAFVATSWCRPWGCRSPFPPRRWRPASPCTMAGMMMHGYFRRWRCCRRCSACGWDSGSARVSARSAFVRAFCCSCWRWG